MKAFNFSNPEDWGLSALVYLYTPASEEYADFVESVFEDIEACNGADGTPFWGYDEALKNSTADSRFQHKGTCDHCGAHFHYGAAYENAEGEVAIVGNVCATNNLNLNAHQYADKKLRTTVKALRSRIEGEIALDKLAPNRRAALSLEHYITTDLRSSFRKWHSLSLKQWALAKKLVVQEAEKAEAKANEPTPVAIPVALTEGRTTITGVLLGTKTEPGYAYNTYVTKMLVMDDRGFKVWGTYPSFGDNNYPEKGARIQFDAALQISDRDECFGFFKRPTKTQVLAAAA